MSLKLMSGFKAIVVLVFVYVYLRLVLLIIDKKSCSLVSFTSTDVEAWLSVGESADVATRTAPVAEEIGLDLLAT